MSEAAIFIVGAILFAATTWATIAFGMNRVQEIHLADLRASGAVAAIKGESKYTYTEHVEMPAKEEQATPPAP